jgi:hypothetical protein
MILALRLLTRDIRRDASGRISQTAVIRVLCAVSRYRFRRICQRYSCRIRIRERCRRAHKHDCAGYADKFLHEILPTPLISFKANPGACFNGIVAIPGIPRMGRAKTSLKEATRQNRE